MTETMYLIDFFVFRRFTSHFIAVTRKSIHSVTLRSTICCIQSPLGRSIGTRRREGCSSSYWNEKYSLKALTRHFASDNRRPGGACMVRVCLMHIYCFALVFNPILTCSVVLMDELDQLVTPKQDVVYNFYNWPTLVGSKLVVIAIANTMDLQEGVMTGQVRSRLGEAFIKRWKL